MRLDVRYLSVPRTGETQNGDAVLVRREGPRTLFALIDALGHGPAAQTVADAAIAHLMECSLEGSVVRVVSGLHEHLRETRGACALVCFVDVETQGGAEVARLSGCSVGNVELRAVGSILPVVATPGVLGRMMRTPRQFEGWLLAGQRVIAHSDGLSSRMELDKLRGRPGEEACRVLMDEYRRPHDDATVLVAELEKVR